MIPTMAAKITAFLLVSLLSLFATKTLATFVSPLMVPSCSVQFNPTKCYEDYKAAYMAAMAGEIGMATSAVPIALSAVNAAKASCSTALQFFNAMKGAGYGVNPSVTWPTTCQSTFTVAVNCLGKASVMMEGKTDLSKSMMAQVQKSVQVATQNVIKCTNSDKNPAIKTLINEPVTLCNVALSFSKQIRTQTH